MASFQAEVLKQPRGFLRCIQWFFAMLAFSTCAGFWGRISFTVTCTQGSNATEPIGQTTVSTAFSYPFQLDHIEKVNYTIANCFGSPLTFSVCYPGDFSSDAKFYVFIGVVCWLYCMLSLYAYTFLSDMYEDPQKNFPLYDMVIAVVLAFMWLASASAWGHGVVGLKSVADPTTWLYSDKEHVPICQKNGDGSYVDLSIKECTPDFVESFGGANVSVIIGFLNLFLWGVNGWYLYKETRFFKPNTGNLENLESPTGST